MSQTLPLFVLGNRWMKMACVPALVALFLLVAGTDAALAEAGTDLRTAQISLGKNINALPPLIAQLCWVAGVFFAASGLLKMKDWINDGDKNPMMGALIRLVVAAMLVWLPHVIVITTGTFFKRADGRIDNNLTVQRGQLSVFKEAGEPL